MPQEFDTHAELVAKAVAQYCSALDLAMETMKSNQQAKLWSEIVTNLQESLHILKQDKACYALLNQWYTACASKPETDIHQFVNALCDHVHLDKSGIESLASNYKKESFWKLMLGIILIIAPPVFLIVALPFLSNPIFIAPLFLLTCALVPLFGNGLVQAGLKDRNLAQTLNQTTSLVVSNGQNKSKCRETFFSDPALAELRAKVVEVYTPGF